MKKNLVYLVVLKPTSHRTSEESLGVAYLAGVLEENNFEVRIRDAWLDSSISTEDIYNEIMDNKDRISFVGTSSYMLSNDVTCDLIKRLTKEGVNVASGGYGPTFEGKKFLNSGSKIVMLGEGESNIVDVASHFSMGLPLIDQIKGIQYMDNEGEIVTTAKAPAIHNLDSIPYPKRPYLDIVKDKKSTVNVLTSRGCKGACTFCSISAFLGKQDSPRWRARSIDNIIPELVQLQNQGATTIKFIDDSFIENERDGEWCRQFAEAVKDNGITMDFRGSIRADKVTADIMSNLRDAGFFSFSCGIENGSPTALKRMAKLASIEDNERALQIFKDNGIYVQAGFILFDNKTTMTELKENYNFMNKYKWLVSKGIFSEMFAAVGTQFTKSAGLENDNKFASNNIYQIEDEQARKVYTYMKKWQAHHSKVYDMVIDPISAPKAIPVPNMKKYYDLMVQMKTIDLDFMRDIISAVELGHNPEEVYANYETQYTDTFRSIMHTAAEYYNFDGLDYNAGTNGFLLNGGQKDVVIAKDAKAKDEMNCV